MSTFAENLEELYLNYDTANILKNESGKEDIIKLFSEELQYPEELTSCFLKLNKTYLNSVIMRIKIRQKNLENKDIKDDILKFNKDLSPLLDKLLSNEKFLEQHKEIVNETVLATTTDEETFDKVELQNIKSIDSFLDEWVENTKDEKDFIKVSTLFQNYEEYCTESEIENSESKSNFKEYLLTKLGKPVNSGYKGYKISEDEE